MATAIAISSVAAWFSIVGLIQIFPAATTALILLGSALEIGKVVAVVWVRQNWRATEATFLKPYLVFAIFVLMVVTSIGIYGFLSKAHLQQQAEAYQPTKNLEQIDSKLAAVNAKLTRATRTASQMDAALDAYIARGYITKGLKQRQTMEQERAEIDANIEALTNEKTALEQTKHEAVMQVKAIELEYGPIKYVAELLGYTDLDSAVRVLILMIMFVFDPLALCLMVAAQISLKQQYWTQEQIDTINKGTHNQQVAQVEAPDAPTAPTPISGGRSKKDPWWRRLQKR